MNRYLRKLKENQKHLTDLAKQIKELKKSYVDVGVIADKETSRAYSNGQSVLEVAAANEYGTKKVPQRSFLRATFYFKKKEVGDFIAKQYQNVFDGKSKTEKSMGLIGAFARNQVLEAFSTSGFGRWQPLKQRTIDEKGSSKTLIDTGILRSSITWRVGNAA